jgi:hypothetical protein
MIKIKYLVTNTTDEHIPGNFVKPHYSNRDLEDVLFHVWLTIVHYVSYPANLTF